MTGSDVPNVDMPNIPRPQRQDEPAVTDADLAALLAGTADAAPGLRPVADVLAALTAEPTGIELTGEDRALAEYRRRAGAPVPAQRARRSTAGLTSRFGVKVGASVTAVAVVLGGGAAAAFAGVLPAPIQRFAHEAIGAPTPPPQHAPPHHGRPGVHRQPAVRGGPGANRQGGPHAASTPTAKGSPPAKGQYGKPHGKGQQGQGGGQGSHGNGQGQGNSQGQGNGQGHHGNGPHGPAQQGSPHKKGPHGSPQMNRRPAGHPRRSTHTRPVMDT